MLWNTQIINTCIVFPSWHIGSTSSFIFSCLIIVVLGVFYEYLRVLQKTFDARLALSLSKGKTRDRSRSRDNSPHGGAEEQGLLTGRLATSRVAVPPVSRAIRAILYGATVFLSFFLMLVFMTYNAYLIFAVVLGAAIGHYIFSDTLSLSDLDSGKGMACH
ncbi:copper transpport protein [Marasmius crinis-equi]|uniref:Copper transport protein n=1 Tax=Marasmius crinis-equi TaxID=585013 RepID=A0ABR3EZM6_9AGAR